jgi:hypothetical protein
VEVVHPVRPFRCVPNFTRQWHARECGVIRPVLSAVH